MDDNDNAADPPTSAADVGDATSVVPPATQAAPEQAWSLDDDEGTVSAERHSWGLAWAQAAVFVSIGAVCALVIGALGWALVRAHDDMRQAPPIAHRAAQVMQTTSTTAPAPSTVTVQATPPTVTVTATPPTVTVEAAPTTVTVPAPISTIRSPRRSSVASPPAAESVYDQRFLDEMRSHGYVITNPQLMLRNAHEACTLFQQGESAEQVNQEMSAQMGTDMADTLQLTSSAMLAYPDCY